MRRALFSSLLFALFACGGSDGDPVNNTPAPTPTGTTPPAPTTTAEPPVAPPIPFAQCSLDSYGKDKLAECANVEVPLDWDKPDGAKMTLFVKRVSGKGPAPRQQVWLLSGGPGGAGDSFDLFAGDLVASNPTIDVYIPDHRGVGRSGQLKCKNIQNPKSCASEIEAKLGAGSLAQFNTTNAARDVGHVIERTRAKDQKVHVFGVSYGTYWAQRYLQIFPKQPSAVTLDSVCQAGLCSFFRMAYWNDFIGKKFLGECAADATCGAKLGPDPIATVREAIAKTNTCAGMQGWDSETLRAVFGTFIKSFELRNLVPAVSHRILRCDAADIAALTQFRKTTQQYFGGGFSGFANEPLDSDVLGFNIAMSEMEESPPITVAARNKLMEGALFETADDYGMRAIYDAWPKYPHDKWVGQYPESNVPVLLMNGTLDTQTPQEFADVVAPHYKKPNQSYVVFPRVPHGVVGSSPMVDARDNCGERIWKAFVAAPTAAIDTSCLAKIKGHDFDKPSQMAQVFFGTPALWSASDAKPNGLVAPAVSDAYIAHLQREVRRARRPF